MTIGTTGARLATGGASTGTYGTTNTYGTTSYGLTGATSGGYANSGSNVRFGYANPGYTTTTTAVTGAAPAFRTSDARFNTVASTIPTTTQCIIYI